MGKKMTDHDRDRIVTLHAFGNNIPEIARTVNYSEGGVLNVINTFDLVKANRHDELAEKIVARSLGENMVRWAYERTGKTIPASVEASFRELHKRSENPDQTIIEMNDTDRLDQIIELLKEILEAVR